MSHQLIQNYLIELPLSISYNLTLYHGTLRETVENIIENGFVESMREDLHLGSGVYFYENEYLAIRWELYKDKPKIFKEIVDKKNKGEQLSINEVNDLIRYFNNEHGVVSTKLNHLKCLDLDNKKVKDMVEEIYWTFYEKNPLGKEKFKSNIYDTLFEKFDLKKRYDAITLTSNILKTSYCSTVPNPINITPYKVFCIKNKHMIKKCFEFEIDENCMKKCINNHILK
jgi:hypothetical protein